MQTTTLGIIIPSPVVERSMLSSVSLTFLFHGSSSTVVHFMAMVILEYQ